MTVVNHETGELIDLDRAAAERRAERILLRLDSIADNTEAVKTMIREAVAKRDDLALDYRSLGEYVSDRFGGSLGRLGVEVRRAFVAELTEAGMSTRAIAPVVGASFKTVARDVAAVSGDTPDPQTSEPAQVGEAESGSEQTPGGGEAQADPMPPTGAPRPPVTGLDGKTYSRPEPTVDPAPRASRRKPLPDFANDAGWDLRKSVERLERIAADDRFGTNKTQVAPLLRSHLENAIEVCQDLLDRINN